MRVKCKMYVNIYFSEIDIKKFYNDNENNDLRLK